MHRLPTADEHWSLSVIGVDRMTRAISGAKDVVFQGSLPSTCVGGSFTCVPIADSARLRAGSASHGVATRSAGSVSGRDADGHFCVCLPSIAGRAASKVAGYGWLSTCA